MRAFAFGVALLSGCWRSEVRPANAPEATEAARPATPLENATTGGVIDMRGEHDDALVRAQEQIRDHCGSDNYVVTQETSEAQGVVTSSAGTVQTTLWHFHYQCGGSR